MACCCVGICKSMKLGICTGFEHVETKTEEVVFREEVDFLSSLAFVVHPASPSGAIFIFSDSSSFRSLRRRNFEGRTAKCHAITASALASSTGRPRGPLRMRMRNFLKETESARYRSRRQPSRAGRSNFRSIFVVADPDSIFLLCSTAIFAWIFAVDLDKLLFVFGCHRSIAEQRWATMWI